ncbi:DNA polymerase III subunit gamma/tau [Paenibacillus sp. NPDC056722]|uniref:DNA polymerase III subunit gamma/tau n=1 Tax=Paenibacillus sp. NPDC056722 TaxID=3345924 RepID=UPI0036A280DE
MFNKGQREDAIGNMKKVQATYEAEKQGFIKDAKQLLDKRQKLQTIINEAWDFINTMSNKPVVLNTELKVIKIETKKFCGLLKTLELRISKASHTSGGLPATDIIAGRGVASHGRTAVLAIATTFGTRASGTTLSSAGSTHAELPWLRNEIQATAREGNATKETSLLGLAGSLGCGAILNVDLLRYKKNKKLAERANTEAAKINQYVSTVETTRKYIQEIIELSTRTTDALLGMVLKCRKFPADYIQLTTEQKQLVDTMVNNTKVGAELLNRVVVDKDISELFVDYKPDSGHRIFSRYI